MCLVKTLTRTKKRCPTCRAVCHNCAQDQPENVMVAQIARAAFPQLYLERLRETQTEKAALRSIHPIFYYNVPMFPGEILSLHLFEPRYRLMMRRIIDTTRRFVYVPNYTNYEASIGDVALIAEVKDCDFQSDGRCYLSATLIGRSRITDHYVEDGTHGLNYCQLETLVDEPIQPHEARFVTTLVQPIANFVSSVLGPIHSDVVKTHGEMPPVAREQEFSLFIAGVLPLGNAEKHSMLACTNTLERLRACAAALGRMGGDNPLRVALAHVLQRVNAEIEISEAAAAAEAAQQRASGDSGSSEADSARGSSTGSC
ncbi:PUA-like domain-containing protein [Tribonema minus]|uniref:PUA-like domain-containing protein n=1 Tax=Tribonema minus TaxID=303371 RepID=A0A835ZAH9_9STRA|nr:PUA-like domain-containing protein [Tribonema minus]